MKFLTDYFVMTWRAGEPAFGHPRGHFVVQITDAGPRFWAYRRPYKTSAREIRRMIAATFAKDRRDGMPPRITGTYPHYVATWEN